MRETARRWFSGPGHTRRYWAACLLLTLFAAALRFNGLGESGLSHDEFEVLLGLRGDIEDIIEQTRIINSSPILNPLLLAGIQKVEMSPFSVRFISALASTLTVTALAVLLPLTGNRRSTAFLAALVASVSIPAIHLASDAARDYSLVTLLVVIILASGMLYLQNKSKYPFFIALFIAPLLHYSIPLFCVAILITIFLKRLQVLSGGGFGKRSVASVAIFMICPALFLAAGSFLTYEITLKYHGVAHGIDRFDLPYYSESYRSIGAILAFSLENFFTMLEYYISYLSFFMIVTVFAAFTISHEFRTSKITILFFISMVIAAAAGVLRLYPFGGVHQTLVWSPILFLLFAHSVTTITDRILSTESRNPRLRLGMVVLIAVLMVAGLANASNRESIRSGHPDSLVVTLDEVKRPGDIVVLGNFMEWTMQFYYPDLPSSIEDYHNRRCDCPGNIIGLFQDDGERMWFILHEDDNVSMSALDRILDTPGIVVRNIFDQGLQLFLIESTNVIRARQYFVDRGELPDVSPGDLADPIIDMRPYGIYREGRYLVYLKPGAMSHGECVEQDAPKFFLHVEPVDSDDLPTGREGDAGFENLDFTFQHGVLRIDGFCFAVRALPEYDVKRITTGQFTRDGRLWARSVSFTEPALSADVLDALDEPLLARHPWEVHGMGRSLVYVNAECVDVEREAPFFLHVWPVDADDLPDHRREWGFENLDFDFAASITIREGERCAASRSLPDWPILRIGTGQYTDDGTRWTGEFAWSGSGAAE